MLRECEVLVVGGGLAGLTAAARSAELGRQTLVLTGPTLGGHLVTIEKIDGLPDYPTGVAGYVLCPEMHIKGAEAGGAFVMEEVDTLQPHGDGWLAKTLHQDYFARVVILATGTRFRRLGVEGEDRLFGRGVSQCASCDAPLMKGKSVAVVGGGDSALQEATTLIPHVSNLTLITDCDRLTGQSVYRDAIVNDTKTEVLFDTVVEKIIGEEAVSTIRVKNQSGLIKNIDVYGVFIFVGLRANSNLVTEYVSIEDGEQIPVDALMRAELPGLFAVGTVRRRTQFRAADASRDGVIAAQTADRYLGDGA